MSSRLTRSARPATSSGTRSSIRWLGTIEPVVSNQKIDIWVSTLPFSGIGSGRTTSKAEIRSDATMISSSPSS